MRGPSPRSDAAADAFLAALEARLQVEVAGTPIAAPARSLLAAGGKRLRARLLWWSACATAPAALDPTNERLIRAAAAIELAHLGSLIHDDLVDGGDMRRGVATLHRSHGLDVATDAGAALAYLATELVAPLGSSARSAVRRALLATCRGQVRELAVAFMPVTPQRRLAIMREKTGAFFELAAALGAIAAGAPPRPRAAVTRFARRFGIAFQIADDVLDLAGDPHELGRANGADLRDGVLTLPILLAFEREPEVIGRALARVRQRPAVDTLTACADLVTRIGGVEGSRAVARGWLHQALKALAPLGHSPAVAALARLAEASITRGIRPAAPRFEGAATSAHPADVASPFVLALPMSVEADAERQLDSRLTHILEWFHPGLAAMVAARIEEPEVRRHRCHTRDALRSNRPWGREAWIAADAIALAHALADTRALIDAPVRTLALADALHCAAIGLLNQTSDPSEHLVMAHRARALGRPAPSAEPTFQPPPSQLQSLAMPFA